MGSIADLAAALAVMPDHELHALRAAIDGEPVHASFRNAVGVANFLDVTAAALYADQGLSGNGH